MINHHTTAANPTTNGRRPRAILAGAAVALAVLVPTSVGAGPVENQEQQCMASATGSADSVQRRSDHCRTLADEHRVAYHDCMHDAPGHADSLERWVDHCAAVAADPD